MPFTGHCSCFACISLQLLSQCFTLLPPPLRLCLRVNCFTHIAWICIESKCARKLALANAIVECRHFFAVGNHFHLNSLHRFFELNHCVSLQCQYKSEIALGFCFECALHGRSTSMSMSSDSHFCVPSRNMLPSVSSTLLGAVAGPVILRVYAFTAHSLRVCPFTPSMKITFK